MSELELPKVINVLQNGEISIKGEFVWGSNYTFLAEVSLDGDKVMSVYKPSRGERPLWDFPPASLARREAAAFWVSEALHWELVPPTVYRRKAPIGPGSLQQFIEHDPEMHYFNLNEADRQLLRPVVIFDLLVNNADRKGSHLLLDDRHHLWLIDHGICFHADDKLRTVIWDFAGETIPARFIADLRLFLRQLAPGTDLSRQLQGLLNQQEIKALARRAERIIGMQCFPEPQPDERNFPWPPI